MRLSSTPAPSDGNVGGHLTKLGSAMWIVRRGGAVSLEICQPVGGQAHVARARAMMRPPLSPPADGRAVGSGAAGRRQRRPRRQGRPAGGRALGSEARRAPTSPPAAVAPRRARAPPPPASQHNTRSTHTDTTVQ